MLLGEVEGFGNEAVYTKFVGLGLPLLPRASIYRIQQSPQPAVFPIPMHRTSVLAGYLRVGLGQAIWVTGVFAYALESSAVWLACGAVTATWLWSMFVLGRLGAGERRRRQLLHDGCGMAAPPAYVPRHLRQRVLSMLQARWSDRSRSVVAWTDAIADASLTESELELLYALAEYADEPGLARQARERIETGDLERAAPARTAPAAAPRMRFEDQDDAEPGYVDWETAVAAAMLRVAQTSAVSKLDASIAALDEAWNKADAAARALVRDFKAATCNSEREAVVENLAPHVDAVATALTRLAMACAANDEETPHIVTERYGAIIAGTLEDLTEAVFEGAAAYLPNVAKEAVGLITMELGFERWKHDEWVLTTEASEAFSSGHMDAVRAKLVEQVVAAAKGTADVTVIRASIQDGAVSPESR